MRPLLGLVGLVGEEACWRRKCFARSLSWGSVRGSEEGMGYAVFWGVSPVGTYSLRGASVIVCRRVESGWAIVVSRVGSAVWRVEVWDVTSAPRSRTRA